jgi:hypothetical protein
MFHLFEISVYPYFFFQWFRDSPPLARILLRLLRLLSLGR